MPPSTAYGCVARQASAAVPSTTMFSAPSDSPRRRSASAFASSSVATERKTCFQRRSGARPSPSSRSATASASRVRGEVDADLPLRAALGRLARLALLERRVLRRLLLRRERQRLVGVLPGLLDRMPLRDQDDAVQIVVLEHLGDHGGGRLGLRAVRGVDEDVLALRRHRQPAVEVVMELARDLALVHPLQQMACADLALQLRVDPPVVTHAARVSRSDRGATRRRWYAGPDVLWRHRWSVGRDLRPGGVPVSCWWHEAGRRRGSGASERRRGPQNFRSRVLASMASRCARSSAG